MLTTEVVHRAAAGGGAVQDVGPKGDRRHLKTNCIHQAICYLERAVIKIDESYTQYPECGTKVYFLYI